jgi:hypothetical protein
MKRNNHYHGAIKTAAFFIFAATASAQSDNGIYQDVTATNRFTLSLRFGLDIDTKFKGIGGSLNPSANIPINRKTPRGDNYNYDNGYVLTDISGNAGNQSWYWGYDNSSQVNTIANTISFNRNTATPSSSSASGSADAGNTGFELAYDRQLGVKADWHNMRYGLELAVNFMPVCVNSSSTFGANVSQQTDVYGYTTGTTPPSAPYQGSYGGPGFVINVPRISTTTAVIPDASVFSQDHFDANLWGIRLGPYVEFPFGKKDQFTLSLSAGLAVGLLDANDSWKQTVTIPGNPTVISSGGGSDFNLLWGGYVGLDADYQLGEHWGISGGVQFQDLGNYSHSFGGREVDLDLSRSLFFLVGVSYSF